MATPPKNLLPSLLELHANGRPPFLQRTLKYVHEAKAASRRRVWTLNSAHSAFTSESSSPCRLLILSIRPSRCFLRSPNPPRNAHLRVTLCLVQRDGHTLSFGYRDVSIRVWSDDYRRRTSRTKLDDFNITHNFDLTSILPMLTNHLKALKLFIQVATPDEHLLTGEVDVWRVGQEYGIAVPNATVTVPLTLSNSQSDTATISQQMRTVSLHDAALNSDTSQQSHTDATGTIDIAFIGSIQETIEKAVTDMLHHKPCVAISLQYSSEDKQEWDGIQRNDFVCPWCHRNLHRYSALIFHFFYEHDDMKFSLMGISQQQQDGDTPKTAQPFSIKFSVRNMDDEPGRRRRAVTDDPRYPYVYTAPKFGNARVKDVKKARRRAASISNSHSQWSRWDDTSSVNTDYDDVNSKSKRDVSRLVQKLCSACWRPHDRSYDKDGRFCSEWCEISTKSQQDEEVPVSRHASVTRPKKINFKEQLGHLKLYHVVTVSEVKEEEFDEDDPDSEEEVDQSWRMQLSLERVRHLEGVTPKEKVLWMMWNEYAHKEYPLPCLYAERYMRYTLELFALEYGERIERCKLRLQFIGFLRALHIHGTIDTVAIKSIMMCLNGLKKRKDIKHSSKPDVLADGPVHRRRANVGRKRGTVSRTLPG